MRKEDSSAQGQIVTEILQHLHACNNSVKVFYGREESLQRIEEYMSNESDKPLVLYGEGGCGKTSLLAKSASLSLTKWFKHCKPISIVRFLGTTPDSSALTPTLISICQQVMMILHFKNSFHLDLEIFSSPANRFPTILCYHLKIFPMTLYR